MRYKKLSNEELQRFPHPNLVAELIESGYSICTLGDHMGLGSRRSEDDPEIFAKLRGEKEILASEAVGLCRLFNVELDYLFSKELKTLGGKTFAYHRWYDWNQRMEREHIESCKREEIEKELREKPYLLDFMKEATKWSRDELEKAVVMLKTISLCPETLSVEPSK